MALLIDTHVLLWYYWDSNQLSTKSREDINNLNNEIYISIASLWEISIKVNQGKLTIKDSLSLFFIDAIEEYGFKILPIELPHLLTQSTLPLHHRDPFDQLLIAQSFSETMPIISADTAFDAYPVTRIW
jgi:PIN domain nuclease of toxin-antitoxin system